MPQAEIVENLEAALEQFRKVTALGPEVASESDAEDNARRPPWPSMRQVTQKSDRHATEIGRISDGFATGNDAFLQQM